MPAVDIKRFNRESAGLLQTFGQPADFLHQLHGLFEQYSNRTIRPRPSLFNPAMPAYQVPMPILRHLDMLLTQKILADGEQGLQIINALWQDGNYECRLLASMLLGKVASNHPMLPTFLTEYVGQTKENSILVQLLSNGVKKMRQEQPTQFLELMSRWVFSHDDKMTECAFAALIHHIRDDRDINLPEIINILLPPIRALPQAFQTTIAELITSIYEKSESEALYFVKQLFFEPLPKTIPAVFRRLLTDLPEGIQPAVTDLLRQKAPLDKNRI